jgi:hypothetical protein
MAEIPLRIIMMFHSPKTLCEITGFFEDFAEKAPLASDLR